MAAGTTTVARRESRVFARCRVLCHAFVARAGGRTDGFLACRRNVVCAGALQDVLRARDFFRRVAVTALAEGGINRAAADAADSDDAEQDDDADELEMPKASGSKTGAGSSRR